MKPKTYQLLERCIDDGISLGYNRSYKHTDDPSEEHMKQEIFRAVMNEICEWFDFDKDGVYDEWK